MLRGSVHGIGAFVLCFFICPTLVHFFVLFRREQYETHAEIFRSKR